jgi:hypothetical protein
MSEHHLDFLNPANKKPHEDDAERSELEIAQQDAWKEKVKRWDLEKKVSTASAKLKFLQDYFEQNTNDNTFALGKITEIIDTLKK